MVSCTKNSGMLCMENLMMKSELSIKIKEQPALAKGEENAELFFRRVGQLTVENY